MKKKSRKKFGEEKDRGLGKGGGRCENNGRTNRAGWERELGRKAGQKGTVFGLGFVLIAT